MKVSDHTMTIMTGLVLTVVVGMLAQNSESIMASFTGQNRIILDDDAFTVRAGKPQVIDILLNDQVPPQTDVTMVKLVETPECGRLEIDQGKFRFTDSATCSGAVTFTYCHVDDPKCKEASVVLQVRPKPGSGPVVASAEVAEATQTSAETQTAALTPPPVVEETDPQVAVAEVEALDSPSTAEAVAEPEVMASLPEMPETETASDIAGVTASANTEAVPEPESTETAAVTPEPAPADTGNADVTVALAEVAPPATPQPAAACPVDLTGEPAAGGAIALSLNAPCLPDSPVRLSQGGFEYVAMTDSAGRLEASMPAFAAEATVEASLPDGVSRSVAVSQPDADRYTRVAVLWWGDINLDLRASEYGAAPGQPGYVWSGDPRDWRQARLKGGGYLESFGTPNGAAEVYSLPVSRRQSPGVVDLSLHVTDGSAICDKDVDLRVLRLEGGASESSQVRFTLAPCGESPDEYEVVNALSDLRVAAR